MSRTRHHESQKWICLDCKVDTRKLYEHYYLKLRIWQRVHSSEAGMLCIGCVERRLGRVLTPEDFTDAWINDPKRNAMSLRLLTRITGQIHQGG